MDTESILKFKKVLEYFVAHLNYMQSGKSQDIPGYAQYIKPYEDNLVIIDDSIVRGTTLKESILRILDRLHPKHEMQGRYASFLL